MELVILIGMQASGKSTFCKERFFDTHVRINLDMLRTRVREGKLFEACLVARLKVVIDNTNPTPEARRRYIEPAKARGYRVVGYFLRSELEECCTRNQQRGADREVPSVALVRTHDNLVWPSRSEGFDELWTVRIDPGGGFIVEDWPSGGP
jgi:predicted kinase